MSAEVERERVQQESRMRQPIDLVLDGTPGNEALIIDDLRLSNPDAGYEGLQRVFRRLCALRDEVVSRRNWEKEVVAHLSELPIRPRSAR